MNALTRIFVASLLLILVGCSAKRPDSHISDSVAKDNGDFQSWDHPIEAQKTGITDVSVIRCIMPDDFILENLVGVYDIDYLKEDGSIGTEKGFVAHFDRNIFYFILQVETRFKIGGADKFLILNRDRGFAYDLLGRQILDNKNGNPSNPFNAEKYDKDPEFRRTFISQYGMNAQGLGAGLTELYAKSGKRISPSQFAPAHYAVGSANWIAMVEEVNAAVARGDLFHVQDKGKERLTWLPENAYRRTASKMTDFDASDRFWKRTGLPLMTMATAFVAPTALILAGGNIAGDIASANIDDSIHAEALRGKVFRYQLIPRVRNMVAMFRALLVEKEKELISLRGHREDTQKNRSLSGPGTGGRHPIGGSDAYSTASN